MRIEHVTNASFVFHLSDGRTILSDPWYTDGIYLGGLFNYPPLKPEARARYLGLRPDFLYISHIHGDHLDPPSLAHYPKETPVLIGRFPNPALKAAISAVGFTDIRELEFEQMAGLGNGLEVCVFPQFALANDFAGEDDDDHAVDTSILIRDSNGTIVFFCVDNPMQTENATAIRDRFGPPDVAILPYAGASIYPFVFRAYSPEEKAVRAAKLRQARLEKLCGIANAMQARSVIPAAGAFVLGGPLARYARYQHQPTPGEIAAFWREGEMTPALHLMATGDVLDTASGTLAQDPAAPDRWFSEADRLAYAASTAQPSPLEEIRMPVRVGWRGLVAAARARMWREQEHSGLKLSHDVILRICGTDGVPLPDTGLSFRLSLDDPSIAIGDARPGRDFTRFHLNTALLLVILTGGTFWNIAEYFMEIEREPDRHTPGVHSLLRYFRV
jgi:L-ascorbate metabolism protein UlaG (beta-lactamase superfamily)